MFLIGKKDCFAIEIDISEYFNNSFIAFGGFRIYINNYAYGLKGNDTTYFGGIVLGLNSILQENIIRDNFFERYSDRKIAKNYIKGVCGGGFRFFRKKKYLGIETNKLRNYFYAMHWDVESAFDDNSCMLLFRDNEKVKLLGFKVKGGQYFKITDIHSVELKREDFDNILRESVTVVLRERDNFFSK